MIEVFKPEKIVRIILETGSREQSLVVVFVLLARYVATKLPRKRHPAMSISSHFE